MLTSISLLTAAIVAALYPLCFWISAADPLKGGFHRFHLGMPLVVGGTVGIYVIVRSFPAPIPALMLLWIICFCAVTFLSWKKEFPDHRLVTGIVFLGVLSYFALQEHLIGLSAADAFAAILGGAVFCAALFAMNLGHWYLNVHGLAVRHLVKATKALGALLIIRIGWDAFLLLNQTVIYRGSPMAMHEFSLTLDGFLLWVGIFFGSLFPLFSLYFVLGTLKLKNTQAATGILYVTLCSVLLGDLTYKYYLIKFGIPL
jgi:hypothetical protein